MINLTRITGIMLRSVRGGNVHQALAAEVQISSSPGDDIRTRRQ